MSSPSFSSEDAVRKELDLADPSTGNGDLEASKEQVLTISAAAEKPHYPRWQWILSLVGLYLGALLYGLDTTIAADVQSAVYERFDDIKDLSWVGLGFPMGSVAVILLIGRFYNLFNTKWLLNTSIFVFEVGSALCGAAPSMNALIVGRVIAGIGGAGMYLGALSFLSYLGAAEKLPIYNALIGVCWGTGAILGPVVGGAFATSSATWRWAFYINLPLAALLIPVYFWVTPSYNPKPSMTVREKFQDFDWVGVVLNAATLVILITVVTFAGATFAWDSSTSIALWTVWGVVLIAYIGQQYFAFFTTTTKRIFPVHLLRSVDMWLLFIATACASAANAVTLYYIPLFFAFSRGDSPLEAAVRLLPFIVVFIFFVMFAGGSLPVVGRYQPYYFLGGILITTGSALMFTMRSDTSITKIYGYEVLIATGAGICFQNGYAVASVKVEEEDRSNAIGFINTAQIGTTALSLAIAGCLYHNLGVKFLHDALQGTGMSDGFVQAALGGAGSALLTRAPPGVAATVVETVAYTISRLFAMVMAAGALLLICAVAMKREKLDLTKAAAGGG